MKKFKDMIPKAQESRTYDPSYSQAEVDLSVHIREVANKITNTCEVEFDLTQEQGDLIYHLVLDGLRYLKNYPRE